jgi:subtilisin family serine protease
VRAYNSVPSWKEWISRLSIEQAAMAWPQQPSRLAVLLWGWLLAIAPAFATDPEKPSSNPTPIPDAGVEEATPDCGSPSAIMASSRPREQVLRRLGIDRWHRLGYRGRGVKIAVLDSGFRGYKSFLGTALPAHVVVRSFRSDGNLEARNSRHGILCAEVLHTLAPQAELLLANWDPNRPDEFLDAARWARQQGARVISCSLIMPSWSDGEGGGRVDEALGQIVGSGRGARDLLFFASAGNIAQRHWAGRYRDNGNGRHEWQPGRSENELIPWGNQRISVEMCWQPGPDYELSVLDGVTGAEVARASGRPASRQSCRRCCAVIRFIPEPLHTYLVRARLREGQPGKFHLAVLGGTLACSRAQGSIPCPADAPAAIAVGAVDGSGQRLCYSSCGPNSSRPKPDFVAAVPFPSTWRQQPFTGTSAAAPQAAALAALWWCRHPDWSAQQIRQAMQQTALDLGPAGHDYETGYGLIRLP